ncbi:MAG: hypothetical protein ACLQT5_13290 [Steroidobacteraceae bacterium]|jgi:hypothetical protein
MGPRLPLDRAYTTHDPDLVSIPAFTIERDLQSLHADTRYKALLHKMNLPGS